jgi:iron(II)-dependent oxidoreductase
MDRLSRKLEVVTAFCSIRPPLFVGFDLTDSTPMRLYVRASANLAEQMQRAYALWPCDLGPARAAWEERNVEFCCADATAFLAALAEQAPASGPAGARAIRVRRPPYKFLDYYEARDADIFCGRDTESQVVARLALSHPLLTLFGPSGAGKTSLLLAGVLPRLAPEGYQHVYVRALDDPLPAVRKAVATRAGRSDWQTGADLGAFLEAVLAPADKLIVVLDQLEELFLRVGSSVRRAFFSQLAAALEGRRREVRVIFSLREDYLASLDEARPWLPDVLANSFRLAALNRSNARVAITEPVARAGIVVKADLVDALVGGEGKLPSPEVGGGAGGGGGGLVEADGLVPPAALQIVLDRLYRAALPAGHPPDDPPPPGLTLSVGRYRTFHHRLGEGEGAAVLYGARAILASYVNEGLARLPALKREDGATPLGADPALGRAILKTMVTGQRTKAALTHDELLDLLDEAGAIRRGDKADRELAENTRLGLERVRLLRGFERDGAALCELAHDHLAAEIATWISREEMDARAVRELLRRELDSWRRHGLLIAAEALRLIHEQRESLRRLSRDETELLLRSALAIVYEVPYWFGRACEAGVATDAIALEGLRSDNLRTRAAAATALDQLDDRFADALIPLLADDYPQARSAAIGSLARLRPDGAWRGRLKYECYVPAGEFIMGDDDGDRANEKPAHKVYLDAYYVGKYPITNADYGRYRADVGRHFDLPAGEADHPVVDVAWYDAADYAAWAGMRLPTEAEWEKAASWEPVDKETRKQGDKGRKRKWPWGDKFDKSRCNTKESGIGTKTPVGQYSPRGDSPYGCADMAGNVWEWCADWYDEDAYRERAGRMTRNPVGPDTGDYKVMRGGAYYNGSEAVRCAYRLGCLPAYRRGVGFRVARSSP